MCILLWVIFSFEVFSEKSICSSELSFWLKMELIIEILEKIMARCMM